MIISTKGRYALRLVVDLAEQNPESFIPLKEIAERQNISKKYLEQIVPALARNGILLTNRGFQGGYRLADAPNKIVIGEILRVTEGSLAPVSCLEHSSNPCERAHDCFTLPLWEGLDKVVKDYLNGVTVQDLLDWHFARESGNYSI